MATTTDNPHEANEFLAAHLDAGWTLPQESTFGDALTILSSQSEPSDAAVKVEYRGWWFYIPMNDLESKATFTRLNVLFASAAGTVPGSAPLLTLPQ